MTLDEAKALFEKYTDSAINYKDSTEVISIDTAFIIIKRVYDDFEKQKSCDGCIHHLSANGNIPLSCMDCSRFYADAFEAKDKFKKCENCKHKDGESGGLTHCSYFEQFMPTEIGKCDKWEDKSAR